MSFVGKWYGFGLSALYDSGIRARERGDLSEAIDKFRHALGDPVEPEFKSVIRRTLANALGRKAKFLLAEAPDEARSLAEEALALEPGFADLWLTLARTQPLAESRGTVERALELNPSYGEALLHRAAFSASLGDFETARELAEKGLASHVRLNTSESKEAVRKLEESDPSAVEALLALRPLDPAVQGLMDDGDLWGLRREWEKADEAYAAAIELAPSFADLRCRRAQTLMELGELDQAEEELRHALTANPRYAEAQAIYGVLCRRLDREEEARKWFSLALESDPAQTIARVERLRG
jgi:tetratricopeptide (TPR) repeat protein